MIIEKNTFLKELLNMKVLIINLLYKLNSITTELISIEELQKDTKEVLNSLLTYNNIVFHIRKDKMEKYETLIQQIIPINSLYLPDYEERIDFLTMHPETTPLSITIFIQVWSDENIFKIKTLPSKNPTNIDKILTNIEQLLNTLAIIEVIFILTLGSIKIEKEEEAYKQD